MYLGVGVYGRKEAQYRGCGGRARRSATERSDRDRRVKIALATFDPIRGSCYGAPTLRRLRYLRTGARALGSAAVFATWVLGSASGCGPVEYLNQVSGKASGAVAAAKQENAERFAPYEYTAAVEYLQKAREEGGYAEYERAIAYGRHAEELAIRARAIARERGAARPGVSPPSEPPGPPGDSP